MRIKKTSQVTPAPTEAQIVDGYSESSTDAYSCNYVNELQEYSTTEKRVGTWINGKPLYRKTIYISSLPNNQTKLYELNISDTTNIELAYIDEANSFLLFSTSGVEQTVTIQYVREDDLSKQIRWNLSYIGNTGNIYISTKSNYSSYSAYLTVKYTKTTDTATT